ncbi:MAG: tRNA (adenosine(37)-N6)-threonylcarbamoyltransferase complex dimerization subunit type 1 TsaB [Saprospiraceae bacterium]|nr:MAG: tRNA (adenosine(37)-N6)-threonylcarbamoyltransferase complex dimerization subunit type 1 TsaB [Saprospiraceae bacterium]
MALILTIETATDICSVGLARNGKPIYHKEAVGTFQHASQITLLIADCAQTAGIQLEELDAVAVSAGPGSYTGLRVGTSTAKGICYALNKPLLAVDTLQSLAHACQLDHPDDAFFVPMIDARRMEVYTAVFDNHAQALTAPEAKVIDETAFAEWLEQGKPIYFCGDGAEKCRKTLPEPAFQFVSILCSANHLAPLAEQAFQAGRFADMAYFAPFYLKPPNITKSKKNILG